MNEVTLFCTKLVLCTRKFHRHVLLAGGQVVSLDFVTRNLLSSPNQNIALQLRCQKEGGNVCYSTFAWLIRYK